MIGHAPSPRVLVVDDDDAFRERLARALRDRGYDVLTAADRHGARVAASSPLSGAVVDLNLGSDSGLDVVADLRRAWPRARLVLATGSLRGSSEQDPRAISALRVLRKPFDADDIVAALAIDDVGD